MVESDPFLRTKRELIERFIAKQLTIWNYLQIPNKLEDTIKHISKNKSIKFKILYIDSSHIKLEILEILIESVQKQSIIIRNRFRKYLLYNFVVHD